MIKAGIGAAAAKDVFADLAFGQGPALKALSLSAATVNRKAKQSQTLSTGDSERVIGLAKLVGQVEAMVAESGEPAGFDAPGWLSRWLQDPLPALGGRRPVELIDTNEGQALISTVLSQIQAGAYG
jgi:putative toxin-antitoxin system antitoxin component (TIGR02293 family)